MGSKVQVKFWETPLWMDCKTAVLKTEDTMSRSEYVRYFGAKEFTEEKYQAYLKTMRIKKAQEPEPEFLMKEY
jgi:hypothetical protein